MKIPRLFQRMLLWLTLLFALITITTGIFCAYTPEPKNPVAWRLD